MNRDLIKNPLTTFYAHVENDSMEPLIHDGAMGIYDSSLEVRHGHTVVAIINNEWCVKHYCEHKGHISLVSENEKYAPIHGSIICFVISAVAFDGLEKVLADN